MWDRIDKRGGVQCTPSGQCPIRSIGMSISKGTQAGKQSTAEERRNHYISLNILGVEPEW